MVSYLYKVVGRKSNHYTDKHLFTKHFRTNSRVLIGAFLSKIMSLLLKLIFSATWRSALLKWCHRGNWSWIVWTFWSFWCGGRLLLSRRLLLLFSASLRNWSRHDLKLLKNVTLFLGRRHLLIRSDEVRNGLRSWYSCDVPVRPGGIEQIWPLAKFSWLNNSK